MGGDRFFYDLGIDQNIAFTLPQLNEVRKTSMARIICDNTDEIDRIQPLAFKMPNPDSSCRSGTGVSLRMPSVISSFFGSVDSMPGRAAATRRNSCFTLYPAFAEVSINMTFNSLAFLSPSSVDTCLLSERSVLFPTNMMMTSLPLSVLTSSIHLLV